MICHRWSFRVALACVFVIAAACSESGTLESFAPAFDKRCSSPGWARNNPDICTPGEPDTQAPSVPQGVSALATSTSRIEVAWTASSDNVGVTGYRVFRNGAQIATVTSTSYANTGLAASTTYTYRVAAFDAAGNISAQSAAASATTHDQPPPPPPPPGDPGDGDPAAGAVTFVNQCSSCHTSRDAMDLAFFRFPDSTIVRRAQPHVTLTEAQDIAAYVATLTPQPGGTRLLRIYQPGGRILGSDVEFAVNLFGKDEWPEFSQWGTQQLLSLVALDVPVAIPMPLWSQEQDNSDWLPAFPPKAKFIAWDALNAYYADRTKTGQLINAVHHTRFNLLNPNDPDAPCPGGNNDAWRYKAVECFESMKWAANLVGQHLIRHGLPRTFDNRLSTAIYRVGYQARQAIVFGMGHELGPHVNMIWAQWTYLGWAIQRPYINNPFYVAEAMPPLNLHRHGTFLLLRDAVDGAPGSLQPWEDVMSLGHHSLAGDWSYRPTKWGLEHLLERLNKGDFPADREQARRYMEIRIPRNIQPKVTAAQWAVLDSLIQQIVAKL